MSEESPTLVKIEETIRAIGKDNRRPWYCSASTICGPVTIRELLDGAEFPYNEGVYVIWGEDGQRPLYVGMTTRGQQRPLHRLKHPRYSPIDMAFKSSGQASLSWRVFFCPLLGNFDRRDPWLPCMLISFERKVVKGLNPWFWHDGLRGNALDCPYVK